MLRLGQGDAGIVAHVITTVLFAGYVADGREIYWWHLTEW